MVSRFLIAAAVLAGATVGLGGCTPVTALNGFVAVDVQPKDVKVGVDTRNTVQAKLGSPSTVGAFDKNTWYYITQTSDKMAYLRPQLKSRTVVEIRFDKDQKVSEVKTVDMKDGYEIAYAQRETPTRGRELSWIEQLLGNVGRGGVLPQDNDPGRVPGGGGNGPTGPH